MKQTGLKWSAFIAVFYFGMSVDAQQKTDSLVKESKIEEVVLIGYGTAKKQDLTGSIVRVSGDVVNDKPSSNPINSLQGQVAGLSVVNSGQPGSQADVRIRGTATINGVNPVYIVDGVFANNIDFLNPADIESLDVLKDASSLAIFGSKGANGAIIITTKRGKNGRTTINLSSSIGVKSFDNRPDLVNAAGFKTLYNEDLVNQGLAPYALYNLFNADTNWIDVVAKKGGIINQNNVTISNGTDKNRVSFSFGYQTEDGSIKYEKYDRLTMKFNDDLKISKNLRTGFGITGSYSHLPQIRSFDNALNATPVVAPINTIPGNFLGLYNSLPQQLGAAQIGNPLAVVEGFRDTQLNKEYQFNPNAYIEFDFFKNFTFKSSYAVQYRNGSGRGYIPVFNIYIPENKQSAPFAGNQLTSVSQFENKDVSFQQDQLLTYKNKFGLHDLTLLAGFETINREISSLSGSGSADVAKLGQIPNDPRFWYLNSIFLDSKTKTSNYNGFKERQVSYFGRMLYNYDRKYLLNASIRRDGSAVLAPGNRFDTFWSVGAAWEISRENFLKDSKYISYFKLKGSYGDLGNQNVAGNLYYGYPTYSESGAGVFNGNITPALSPNFVVNPDLHWEHLKSYEGGFESSFFNRKLTLEATYYNKKSVGLLNQTSNVSNFYLNSGSIESKGFEFSMGWNGKVSENFSYFINGNLSTTKTKVLETRLEGSQDFFGPSIYSKGLPVGAFYGYIVEGVYQSYADILASPPSTIGDVAPGDLKYKDINGDGKIDANDRTIIGNPTPDFSYGINIGAEFKGFFLNADLYGVYGNEVFRNWGNGNTFAPFNYREERLGRWTGPGTSNFEPRSYSASNYNSQNSTYEIEDGSFFRIRNVQLGYNFGKNLISGLKLQAFKVYMNVQNLKTWDHVNGFTPEAGGSATQFGVNNGGYPNPRITSFGINATF